MRKISFFLKILAKFVILILGSICVVPVLNFSGRFRHNNPKGDVMMNDDFYRCENSESSEETAVQENENADRGASIFDAGSVTTCSGKYKIHCLTVIGQIEGHYISSSQNKTTKYEHVIPQLVAVEEDPSIDGLLLLLNSLQL